MNASILSVLFTLGVFITTFAAPIPNPHDDKAVSTLYITDLVTPSTTVELFEFVTQNPKALQNVPTAVLFFPPYVASTSAHSMPPFLNLIPISLPPRPSSPLQTPPELLLPPSVPPPLQTLVNILPPSPTTTLPLQTLIAFVPPTQTTQTTTVSIQTLIDVFPTTTTSTLSIQTLINVFPMSSSPTSPTSAQTLINVFPAASPTATWAAPPTLTNIDCFGVDKFAYGKQNLQIVNGIPASATATAMSINFAAIAAPTVAPMAWNNDSSVMQVFFPKGSINPGNSPQGGADIYASPIPLDNATEVTLDYSVFFPVDFAFVKGGKLPGLYGGHTACSGGDDATQCFSTRMMWRANGAGELYLYAPKDKQTTKTCNTPPLSICGSDYGLSIGRGSFSFIPGRWTDLRQIVRLNTPGLQDGGFILLVNGQEILNLNQIYYRSDNSTVTAAADQVPSSSLLPPPAPPSPPALGPTSQGGNLVGDLVGGIGQIIANATNPILRDGMVPRSPLEDIPPLFNTSAGPITSNSVALNNTLAIQEAALSGSPASGIPFTGIFFSTFFGGHETEYASPKDQYIWFKGFAMTAL